MLVALVLFPILAVLGFLMRVLQAGFFASVTPDLFYAVMTLRGLGMVGLWFVAGMAAAHRDRRVGREPRRVADTARHHDRHVRSRRAID